MPVFDFNSVPDEEKKNAVCTYEIFMSSEESATPSKDTTSENSGLLMIIPIPFAVSCGEPPPTHAYFANVFGLTGKPCLMQYSAACPRVKYSFPDFHNELLWLISNAFTVA